VSFFSPAAITGGSKRSSIEKGKGKGDSGGNFSHSRGYILVRQASSLPLGHAAILEINRGGANGNVVDGLAVSVGISSSAIASAIWDRSVVGGMTAIVVPSVTAVKIRGVDRAEAGVGPSLEAFSFRFALGYFVGFSPGDKDGVLIHAIFDPAGFYHAALRIRDFLKNDGIFLDAALRRARSATGENEGRCGKKGEVDQFHDE
jgi:hypothetical protein